MTLNTTTRQPLAPPPVTDTGGDMGMVALVAMLTACSSEDVLLDEPNAKNEITFNVTTNRASRAASLYDSGNLPESFNLYAYMHTDDADSYTLYMNGDVVKNESKTNTPQWVNQGGLRYWPNKEGQKLDFYVFTGEGDGGADGLVFADFIEDRADHPIIGGFKQSQDASLQTDFMYGMAFNQSKAGNNTANTDIDIDFEHALTQVVFDAKTVSDKLYIEIAEVGFVNIDDCGDLNLPATESGSVSWSIMEDPNSASIAELQNPIGISKNMGTVALTYVKNAEEGNPSIVGQALLNLPYEYTKGVPVMNKTIKSGKYVPEDWHGAFIRIKCAIWNIANPNENDENGGFDTDSDVILYGEKGDDGIKYEYIFIPVEIDWTGLMGKRIIYSLSFGSGNAGYTTNGEYVIEGVSYHIEFTDWASGDTKPIEE